MAKAMAQPTEAASHRRVCPAGSRAVSGTSHSRNGSQMRSTSDFDSPEVVAALLVSAETSGT
jgi:hypothetical protein